MIRRQAAERRASLVPKQFRIDRIHESRWPPGRRWCARCQCMVRLSDCAGSQCKACASIGSRRSRVKTTFGLDDPTVQWLRDKQLGKCAICRVRPRRADLHIDHDHHLSDEHKCGTGCPKCVRGMLCTICNGTLLVAGKHDPQIFLNAAMYLMNPPMRSEDWQPPEPELAEWRARYGNDDIAPY